ncbi:hypothetical protein WJX72_003783 [[Myrmecia] bisecta]|uniref:SBP-type domain-containing protein n=1 Tax=[Myrmecia] bisecta TaxID=41462 RepID=A0AAW1QEP7_9CHLO
MAHPASLSSTSPGWATQDWSWDPYQLSAQPSDLKGVSQTRKAQNSALARYQGVAGFLGDEPSRPSNTKGKGPPTCQVEGCMADLTALKEYHQRYKICEVHLKVPSIVRERRSQRFCQQCGRFHDLGEFDADKRSCRARLQRHNARRRKKADGETEAADADTVSATTSGYTGKLTPAAKKPAPSVVAIKKGLRSAAAAAAAAEKEAAAVLKQEDTYTPAGLHAGDWQQSTNLPPDQVLESALSELLNDTAHTSRANAGHHTSLQSLHNVLANEASSKQKDQMDFNTLFEDSSNQSAHTTYQPSRYSAEQQSAYDEAMTDSSMGLGYGFGAAGMQAQGMPFGSAVPVMHPSSLHQAQEAYLAAQQRIHSGLASMDPMQMDMAMPDYSDLDFVAHHNMQAAYSAQQAHAHAMYPQHAMAGGTPLSVLDEARTMLGYQAAQQQYLPEDQFTRMSAKLFNCTPAHLPNDLKQNLVGLLSCGVNSIEGYIRPGCVHLTLNAVIAPAQSNNLKGMGIREAVKSLIEGQGREFWSAETVLIQMHDEVALVREGEVLHVLSGSGSRGVFPQVDKISPLALLTSDPEVITVTGTNIASNENSVLCRCQGAYVPAKVVLPVTNSEEAELDIARQELQLRIPRGQRNGAVQVEVVRGGFMSHAKPVLVLDNTQAVAEIRQLEAGASADADAFLLDFDRVLEFTNALKAVAANSQEPMREYTTEDCKAVAHTARRLFLFAASKGWPAVAQLLLPVACVECRNVAEVVAEWDKLTAGQLSVLHLAVRSQSADMVALLLDFAACGGFQFDVTKAAARGITPLHLAAMLPDNGAIADLLTDLSPAARDAWTSASAEAGQTPADFAKLTGRTATLARMERKLAGEADASDVGSICSDDGYTFDPETGEILELQDTVVVEAPIKSPFNIPVSEQNAVPQPPLPEATQAGTMPATRSLTMSSAASTSTQCSTLTASTSTSLDPLPGFSEHPSEELRAQQLCVAEKCEGHCGSRSTSKSFGATFGVYDEYYMDCGLYGVSVAPTVFDRTSAAISAGIIGCIGATTLFLRYYVDYFMD